MQIRAAFLALRGPVIWLGGCLGIVLNPTLIPNLVILASHGLPARTAFLALQVRLDYFLYLPNVVFLLSFGMGVFALLEIKQALHPWNRSVREDVASGLIGLGLALTPLPWMANAKEGLLQLFLNGMLVIPLWLFIECNAGLYLVQRHLIRRQWFFPVLDVTFPISDLLFYVIHRQRIGASAGRLRWVPPLTAAGILLTILGIEGQILLESVRAKRIDAPVVTAGWVQYVKGGFWFSNMNWWDPEGGIWYFDESVNRAFPYIRVGDARVFHLVDGAFYFHDRLDHQMVKVDAETKQVLWKYPVKPHGTPELWVRNGLVYVMGEDGYILVLDTNGRFVAERAFPNHLYATQVFRDGRVSFWLGDQQFQIWDSRLKTSETIPFPTRPGILKVPDQGGRGQTGVPHCWSDYDERSDIYYANTYWGEIYRYDLQQRRWLSSLKTWPGIRTVSIDKPNGLLFALNYFQGFMEVLDLHTGEHVGYVLGNGLGRYIAFDSSNARGVLTTHGYGVYRFDYGSLLAHRQGSFGRSRGRLSAHR